MGQGPSQVRPHTATDGSRLGSQKGPSPCGVEAAGRFNQGQDISQSGSTMERGKSPEAAKLRTKRGYGRWLSKDVDTSGQGGQSKPSRGGILPSAQWTRGRGIRGATKAQGTGKQGPGQTSPRTGQEGRREQEPELSGSAPGRGAEGSGRSTERSRHSGGGTLVPNKWGDLS